MHVYRLPKLFTQDIGINELIFEGDWIVRKQEPCVRAPLRRGHTTCSTTPTTTPTTPGWCEGRGIRKCQANPQSYAAAERNDRGDRVNPWDGKYEIIPESCKDCGTDIMHDPVQGRTLPRLPPSSTTPGSWPFEGRATCQTTEDRLVSEERSEGLSQYLQIASSQREPRYSLARGSPLLQGLSSRTQPLLEAVSQPTLEVDSEISNASAIVRCGTGCHTPQSSSPLRHVETVQRSVDVGECRLEVPPLIMTPDLIVVHLIDGHSVPLISTPIQSLIASGVYQTRSTNSYPPSFLSSSGGTARLHAEAWSARRTNPCVGPAFLLVHVLRTSLPPGKQPKLLTDIRIIQDADYPSPVDTGTHDGHGLGQLLCVAVGPICFSFPRELLPLENKTVSVEGDSLE